MLMSPMIYGETLQQFQSVAADCPGVMALRMRTLLAGSWVGIRVCHLLFKFLFKLLQFPTRVPL